MKLAFFELEKWEQEYVKLKIKNHKLLFFDEELSEKHIPKIKDVDGLCIFIYSEINKKILEQLVKLKFISTMSTGYDHIDLIKCKDKCVRISNVPFYGENTVAEHTIGLMLSLSKKIPQSVSRAKDDNFDIKGLEGFDIKGKTLGVIGAGHIGQHVIKIAKAMDMKVIAYTKTKEKKLAAKLGFSYVSLDNLLSKSDLITIHCPLNNQTRHMINMGNIIKIKKGSYLINTARGEIVDTQALIYALDNGILKGAALDVLEGEEDLKEEREFLRGKLNRDKMKTFLRNHLLLKDKDVIITPHTAFYTREALQRILDTTIENIKSRGKLNRVA